MAQRRCWYIDVVTIVLLLACWHVAVGQLLHPDDCEVLREWSELAARLQLSKCNPPPSCSELSNSINCDIDGRVSELMLSNTNINGMLNGTLPAIWSRMTKLELMDLSNTNISGTLPDSWSRMSALSGMFLSNTNVSGTLPSSWGGMPELAYINLSITNINGTLPSSWSRMPKLDSLVLSNTRISGTLPDSWHRMSAITYMKLSNTSITGELPSSWSNISLLSTMDLSNTNISGTLPSSWSRMPALSTMDLSSTNIAGTLPDSWSGMPALSFMNLSITNIHGTLPSSWSRMPTIATMDLSNSHIRGTLPDIWSKMPLIYAIDLSSNNISGTLPNSWSKLVKLYSMDISNTSVSGTLPDSWKGMHDLFFMDLSNTSLNGMIPDSWSELPKLLSVDLSNTSISGTLPDSWSRMPALKFVALSNTSISGTLPDSWRRMRALYSLDLSNNNISGTLPDSWSTTQISHLDLSSSNINGTIPDSWGQHQFSYLNLSSNYLQGTLPALGSRCLVLDLANNRLTGTLPQLSKMDMILLSASHNLLQGAIPALPKMLVFLQLSNNNLTGAIPDLPVTSAMRAMALDNNKLEKLPGVFAAPNATYLSAAGNMLQGSLPTGYNHSLDFCDLSSNMLSGNIPASSWSEKRWLYLALDNNRLSGKLPGDWLGGVSVLLLQNNSITGCLPTTWMNNNTLQVLSLSKNRLQCETGLPQLWGQQADAFSNLTVVSLEGNGDLGQIPTSWLKAFNKRGTKLLMGEAWAASATHRKWRREVCIQKGINDIVSSQLNIPSLEAIALRDVRQAFQARFTILAAEIKQRVLLEYSTVTDLPFVRSHEVIKSPQLPVAQIKLRLTNAIQPSLKTVCGNRSAKFVVALLWSVCGTLLLLLVLVYNAQVKWKLVTAMLRILRRSKRQGVGGQGTLHGQSSGRFAKTIGAGKTFALGMGLLLYWADIAIDIVLLQQVWAVRAGLKWGLLFILLLHYITAMSLVSWRWTRGQGMWQRCVNILLSLWLVPVLPLVDTAVFCVLAYNQFIQRPIDNCPEWLQNILLDIPTCEAFFNMRDTLEVVLEAVPTAVVQAVAFVVGNTPKLGIYLDTWLYCASAAGSGIQILRLVAFVLWTAWEQDVSPWRALADRLLWSSNQHSQQLACTLLLKSVEILPRPFGRCSDTVSISAKP